MIKLNDFGFLKKKENGREADYELCKSHTYSPITDKMKSINFNLVKARSLEKLGFTRREEADCHVNLFNDLTKPAYLSCMNPNEY